MGRNAKLRHVKRAAKAFNKCANWNEALDCAIEQFKKYTRCDPCLPVWGCTYWRGDYSVGYAGYSLGEAIDISYDLEAEWEANPLRVFNSFANALMTGKASFGDADFGISVYFEG